MRSTRRSARASSPGPSSRTSANGSLAHHERPDGTRLSAGLATRDPARAKILSVADAYEAMTSDRVYRAAIGAEPPAPSSSAGAGTQFDADVVDVFLRILDAGRARRLRRVA